MKPTTYTFDIPTPCHEKWSNMDQRSDGRFCRSCQKTVVDFSKMSNQEMVSYFQKTTGNICGRIRKDRLLNPIQNNQPKRWSNTFKALGLLLSGLLIGTDVEGQSTEKHHPINLEVNELDYMLGFFVPQSGYKLRGVVRDEDGLPLTGVSILPKAPVIGALSDNHGNFEIDVPTTPEGKLVTLEISFEGFKRIEIEPIKIDNKNVEIVLKRNNK